MIEALAIVAGYLGIGAAGTLALALLNKEAGQTMMWDDRPLALFLVIALFWPFGVAYAAAASCSGWLNRAFYRLLVRRWG